MKWNFKNADTITHTNVGTLYHVAVLVIEVGCVWLLFKILKEVRRKKEPEEEIPLFV